VRLSVTDEKKGKLARALVFAGTDGKARKAFLQLFVHHFEAELIAFECSCVITCISHTARKSIYGYLRHEKGGAELRLATAFLLSRRNFLELEPRPKLHLERRPRIVVEQYFAKPSRRRVTIYQLKEVGICRPDEPAVCGNRGCRRHRRAEGR
jgi:hypothetical protein